MYTCPYYPNRLIRDGRGFIIEQDKAPPHFKRADAVALAKEYGADDIRARQAAHEADIFDAWAAEQRNKGRPNIEITFGNCIRELGLLVPTDT